MARKEEVKVAEVLTKKLQDGSSTGEDLKCPKVKKQERCLKARGCWLKNQPR